MKPRFFMDASAIFSMITSKTGGARELLRLAILEQITLITSTYAFIEVKRAIGRHDPSLTHFVDQLQAQSFWRIVNHDPNEIPNAKQAVTDPDDAPIIAATKLAKVDGLIIFDRKHLHTKEVEAYINAPVITPGDALQLIRSSQ